MDGQVLAGMLTILANKPRGSGAPWGDGMEMIYQIGLEDVPNSAFEALSRWVIKQARFRPEPVDLIEAWRRISAPTPDVSFADALIEVRGLIRKFGANARRVPGSNIYLPGPPEFSSEIVAKTVDAMGGWEALATDPGEARIWQAQFERVFHAISKQAGEPEIAKLRLEYAEQRRSPHLVTVDEEAA